jgi:DNA-binding MarR family transcriptional regulator
MFYRLVRQGLVARYAAPHDTRATRLCLSAASEAMREEVESRCCAVNERLMSKFSKEDYERFLQLVRQFAQEAESECAGAQPAR